LSIKAFEMADKGQLKILSELFGNRNVSLDEINDFREIIKKTGSLDYSLKNIDSLIKLSKARFEKMEIPEKYKGHLLRLADFIVKGKY